MSVPIASGSNVRFEGQDELLYRAYLYWTPHKIISISAEYQFEDFDREITPLSVLVEPRKLTTHSLPLSLNLYHPNGWTGGLTATYYDQNLIQPLTATTSRIDKDEFWIVDARVGYRLPQRLGRIDIELRNLADKEFKYHDASFRTGLAQPATIYHERTAWIRVIFNFD